MSAREVRGEVLVGPERRRRWSVEEKLRILAQSVVPGSSVMLVCRMHGISSGQLYTWRRRFRTGELTGFAPVRASPPLGQLASITADVEPAPASPEVDRPASGAIEVELPSAVKLRLTGAVDATKNLRRLEAESITILREVAFDRQRFKRPPAPGVEGVLPGEAAFAAIARRYDVEVPRNDRIRDRPRSGWVSI